MARLYFWVERIVSLLSAITAEQMRHVLDVSRLLVVTSDLQLLLRRIAEAAIMLLGAERASIFLHDPSQRVLWTRIALGCDEIRVPDSAGIVGHVFQTNLQLTIPDAYADARFNQIIDRRTGFVTRNLLAIPLPDITDHPIGVLQDGQLGIFLGDASGHGLAPAMIVSQARTLIRALSEINGDPQWLLTRVNARLTNDMDDSRFVTAFAGRASPEGCIRWWSAGHGPIFVRPAPDSPIEILLPQSPPLGVDPDMPASDPDCIQLAPGGQLFILSDGIFESPRADDGELFGIPRLINLFNEGIHDSPADLIARIRAAMIQWHGSGNPADDQTAVIVRRTAK